MSTLLLDFVYRQLLRNSMKNLIQILMLMKSTVSFKESCTHVFSNFRYTEPHNKIVAEYLIGQLVEKFPLDPVKSETCNSIYLYISMRQNVHALADKTKCTELLKFCMNAKHCLLLHHMCNNCMQLCLLRSTSMIHFVFNCVSIVNLALLCKYIGNTLVIYIFLPIVTF